MIKHHDHPTASMGVFSVLCASRRHRPVQVSEAASDSLSSHGTEPGCHRMAIRQK